MFSIKGFGARQHSQRSVATDYPAVLLCVDVFLNRAHYFAALGTKVVDKHIAPAMATVRAGSIERVTTFHTKLLVPACDVVTSWTMKSVHFCFFFFELNHQYSSFFYASM